MYQYMQNRQASKQGPRQTNKPTPKILETTPANSESSVTSEVVIPKRMYNCFATKLEALQARSLEYESKYTVAQQSTANVTKIMRDEIDTYGKQIRDLQAQNALLKTALSKNADKTKISKEQIQQQTDLLQDEEKYAKKLDELMKNERKKAEEREAELRKQLQTQRGSIFQFNYA